jgi:hypothetical protein
MDGGALDHVDHTMHGPDEFKVGGQVGFNELHAGIGKSPEDEVQVLAHYDRAAGDELLEDADPERTRGDP